MLFSMALSICKLAILSRHISPIPLFFYSCPKLLLLSNLSLSSVCWNSDVPTKLVDETEFIIKPSESPESGLKAREWKKISSKELGISTSLISEPTRVVLKRLKKKGYEVYLVGGCVRDLILKRIPKDFDILTSAELREVKRTFPRCEIVGKRFPICHVHIDNNVLEVSSFSTGQQKYNRNLSFAVGGPISCDEGDKVRWRNCIQRDFTVNGLMFDPFARLIFDYFGGLEDIRKAKLQTIIPASTSFREDNARILRAIRIAARLGFSLSRETVQSIKNLSCLILRLDKARILMEMNYMLAYGSAEASLRLLWKFGLLELLLPHQHILFVVAFGDVTLDQTCFWVTILAFHKALSDHPRAPSVIAAFTLAVNNGGDIAEAVDIASLISRASEQSFCELQESQSLEKMVLRDHVLCLAGSVNRALSDMTDGNVVSKAMAKYPLAPYSDLVFIPLGLYLRVCRIFECVDKGKEKGFLPKKDGKIDYQMLAVGGLQEVRHMFARVVFETVYPLSLVEDHTIIYCNADTFKRKKRGGGCARDNCDLIM
ncbi:uncharacterized protein LOC104893895 isoform X2 [Beta vulgaris subsp. vulgaris]|uniref:uncharacterized protein LOC104893895 isoform X2 n=1 Tax=Beta vulgaris subsp. vulgaris TaxID=3555 RepID=UPI0020374E59|nr:uncharacterized protein LOC104893895 isoform X2 [Beta vulgaris subsp. vulgaris]